MSHTRRAFLYLASLAGLTPIAAQAEQPHGKFSFCVGRPWPAEKTLDGYNPDNICVYAYGSQVHCGTIEDAKTLQGYVNRQTDDENHIYKLVRIA